MEGFGGVIALIIAAVAALFLANRQGKEAGRREAEVEGAEEVHDIREEVANEKLAEIRGRSILDRIDRIRRKYGLRTGKEHAGDGD